MSRSPKVVITVFQYSGLLRLFEVALELIYQHVPVSFVVASISSSDGMLGKNDWGV